MYQNYSRQKNGYGERQMTKREYEAMNQSDKWIIRGWLFLVAVLAVAVLAGLRMRGVL